MSTERARGEETEEDQVMSEVEEASEASQTGKEDDEREERRRRREENRHENESLLDEEEEEEDLQEKQLPMKDRLRNAANVIQPKNAIEIKKLSKPEANPSGAEGNISIAANPSGVAKDSPYPSGGELLKGQSESVNKAYETVAALRSGQRTNPSLSQGGKRVFEKGRLGSFANSGDGRAGSAHFRSLTEHRLNRNISYSFDPRNCSCSICPGRGSHQVSGGGWGRIHKANVCFVRSKFSSHFSLFCG